MAVTVPAIANADDGDDETIVINRATPGLPAVEHRPHPGLAIRFSRELTWSRLVLAEDALTPTDHQGRAIGSVPDLLEGLDVRDATWTAQPRAITSVASAVGQLATGGLSLFDVWHNGGVRQRHYLRPYFRTSGLKLVWRIEF